MQENPSRTRKRNKELRSSFRRLELLLPPELDEYVRTAARARFVPEGTFIKLLLADARQRGEQAA